MVATVVEAVAAAVEAITVRIYIHMVPVAVRLHAHMPAVVAAAVAMVDDDNSTQVAVPVDHRIVVVPEQCIMGMVAMAEVSNIIHRKMSRTSQFQHRKIQTQYLNKQTHTHSHKHTESEKD